MRVPAALVLSAVAVLAVPAAASPAQTSYRVHVLPDPTQGHTPYGLCGAGEASVLGTAIGADMRSFTVRPGETLKAELQPDLNVFAGDVGLQWSLRLLDAGFNELTRSSSGPAWRAPTVSRRFGTAQRVLLVACNSNGFPDATVTVTRG